MIFFPNTNEMIKEVIKAKAARNEMY
jgi:hypothetical protein